MANYGSPGGGPHPWHDPRPGEAHDPRQSYRPEQSYGPEQGYRPEQGYGSEQGYGPEQGYRPEQGYGSEQGYGRGQVYGGGPHGSAGPPYGSGPPGSAYPGGQQGPGRPGPEYDAASAYAGQPTPPGRRRGRGLVLAAVGAALVLILAGGTAFYLFAGDDEPPTTVAAPTEVPVPTTGTLEEDEEVGPSDPAASSSADPRFVEPGQCVRNDAPAGAKPRLLISDCAPKSYEVLRRFDGKTSGEKDAEAKCSRVDGYTNWYFYDSELDSLDFVLCLKQRD